MGQFEHNIAQNPKIEVPRPAERSLVTDRRLLFDQLRLPLANSGQILAGFHPSPCVFDEYRLRIDKAWPTAQFWSTLAPEFDSRSNSSTTVGQLLANFGIRRDRRGNFPGRMISHLSMIFGWLSSPCHHRRSDWSNIFPNGHGEGVRSESASPCSIFAAWRSAQKEPS